MKYHLSKKHEPNSQQVINFQLALVHFFIYKWKLL